MRLTRPVLAWCLYDLANTIFAMNMTSYHFPVWVVSDLGGKELWYSLAFGSSMLVSALLMPCLGAAADRGWGRVRPMALCTVVCVVLTGVLSWIPSLPLALTLFALANFFYQLAGLFYNALLPGIAPSGALGKVSGAGVALGYIGTLIGIVATAPFADRWGRQATFLPTALLFLLAALPSFFWIKEKGAASAPASAKPVLSLSKDSARTAEPVRTVLAPLLPSAFLGLCVVGVAILFMSVYAKQAIGLTDAELQTLLLGATAVTILASFGWGWLTDRFGGFRVLGWVWWFWVLAFGLASLSFDKRLFIVVACLSGAAMGGTWVSSRVMLIERVGPDRVGEAFGLFGLISRISAVVGPVAWGAILWVAEPLGPVRYRLATLFLFLCALASGWMYRRLPPGSSDRMA